MASAKGKAATPPRLRRIVVGVNFTPYSQQAAQWAARRLGKTCELLLVHCVDAPRPPRFLAASGPAHTEVVESATSSAAIELRQVAAGVGVTRVKTEVREGPTAQQLALAAQERNAQMIVVGAHAPRGKLRDLLPLVPERLIQESHVPVLMARDIDPDTPEHILAVIDHSAIGRAVLRWSRALSELLNASVTTLHVVSDAYYDLASQVYGSRGEKAMKDHALGAARRWLEKQVSQAGFKPGTVDVRVRLGDARFEILAAEKAYGTDLTAVGSRGAGSVRGRLLGSVVVTLLRASRGSVLVLPADKGPRRT